MRLHRLEFRGMGPFREPQVVDFASLGASGLFLLEGPTGAGKSTIIDAIVFALYGSVAGASADRGRLVSDFLAPGEAPFAELVFETNAGVYLIRRMPTFEAPKARGTGTTTRNGTVTLTRLTAPGDASGEPVSTSQRETGDEIIRILGLTKEQFVGTVVLPQGEFATFLRAEGRERQPILQRIFRTEPYERLQRRLWEARAVAERSRQAAGHALDVALGGFHVAAGTDSDDDRWGALDRTDSVALADAVEACLAELAEVSSNAHRVARTAGTSLASARTAHEAVLDRMRRRDRLRDAQSRRTALDADATAADECLARLDAAQRADRVADALAAATRAVAVVGRAKAADDRARSALPTDQQQLLEPDLAEAVESARAATAELHPMAEQERLLPGRERALEGLRDDHAAAQAALDGHDASLAALPAKLAGLREARDRARELAAQVDPLAADVGRSRIRHDEALAHQAADHAREDARQATVEAVAALATVEATARDRSDGYRAGLAAELGAELTPDAPCPVCGSCEHPAPAQPSASHVSRAAVDEAEAAVRSARTEAEEARAGLAAAEARLERHAAGALGLAPAAAAKALDAAERALAGAQAAAKDAAQLDRAIAHDEAEQVRLSERRSDALASVSALAAALVEQGARLAEDRAAVDAARLGHPTVAARLAELVHQSDSLRCAHEAARALAAADTSAVQASDALALALTREHFADAVEAQDAALTPAERNALIERVRQREAEVAQVAGILAEPELAGVDADEPIDPATTADVLAEATRAHEEAVADAARLGGRVADAASQAAAVRTAAQERDTCVAETEPLLRVARLASGNNVLSMDLATYVLQRRFDAVVVAANEHLRVMSDGTLALVTTEDAEGRSRRAGLGLRVVDLRTGHERSPRTLSGGETFYTALALALGLASVVTSEAGGVDLGTLFVDEGFGSLDDDTLNEVLGVLTSLRAGGRVIGVVSHVEEMKQRIPERIEVRRDEALGHSAVRVVA